MFFYDRNKRLTKISNISNNNETSTLYFYDTSGLLISKEIIPDLNSNMPLKTTYEYNNDRQLILEREDSLYKTSYSYNTNGKLISKLTDYPQRPELFTYKYDALNRLIEISRNNEKEISYVYSNSLVIAEIHYNQNKALYKFEYKYDYQGLRLEEMENDKIIKKNVYDSYNRLKESCTFYYGIDPCYRSCCSEYVYRYEYY
jgi:YD repeat-containing protein